MYSMSINLLQAGDTALLLACSEGKVDVVKVLLQAGADKNILNNVRNVVCFCNIVLLCMYYSYMYR